MATSTSHRFFVFWISLLCLCTTSCSNTTDPPLLTPDAFTLNGRLDASFLSDRSAGLSEAEFWIHAVNETGDSEDSQIFEPPFEPVIPFSLEVSPEHDLMVELRSGESTGPTLAILVLGEGTEARSVFSLPAERAEVDLGLISVNPETRLAVSNIDQALQTLLPPPDTIYRDLDGDLLPDPFDRDDDNDGIPDPQDNVPGIVRFSLDGGTLNLDTPRGSLDVSIWMAGSYDRTSRQLSLDPHYAPRFTFISNLDFDLLYNGFSIWPDTLPVVIDQAGDMISGNLRIAPSPGQVQLKIHSYVVKLKANPDVDGMGTPGYDVRRYDFGEFVDLTRLSCQDFACLGNDPENEEDFLLLAWAAWKGITHLMGNARLLLDSFDFCIQHKQELLDLREFLDEDLVVPCDLFPGNGSQGSVVYRWQDEDSACGINPGDSFIVTFGNCWMEDLGDLLDGRIDIRYYIDIRGDQNQILMGANFVAFEELTRRQTQAGSIDDDSAVATTSFAYGNTYGGPAFWVEF